MFCLQLQWRKKIRVGWLAIVKNANKHTIVCITLLQLIVGNKEGIKCLFLFIFCFSFLFTYMYCIRSNSRPSSEYHSQTYLYDCKTDCVFRRYTDRNSIGKLNETRRIIFLEKSEWTYANIFSNISSIQPENALNVYIECNLINVSPF